MISQETKFDNMRGRYREVQRQNKELKRKVIDLLRSFDGDKATELWEEDRMPSREWMRRMSGLLYELSPPPRRKKKRK